MGIPAFARAFGNLGRISGRVSSLSGKSGVALRLSRASLSHGARRKLAAAGLLALSVASAVKGVEICRESALSEWERTRFPSEKAWTHALGSRGYRRLENPRILQKINHTLPMSLDSNLSAWISPDSLWVTIFLKPDSALPQAIFCFRCAPPFPKSWESQGNSWEGFDRTLGRLDATANGRKAAPGILRPSSRRDPREIRY